MEYLYGEVIPLVAMVTAETTDVGMSTLFKAATKKGLNYHVYMFYSYALSTLLLLPLALFFHRKSTSLPPMNVSLALRFFFLGVIGFTVQLMGYKGIEYASPTVGSVMSNLVPAATFVLAVLLRMEKFSFTEVKSLAKLIGTIVSVLGAIIVILYKGKIVIVNEPTPSSNSLSDPISSPESNWIVGGGLLAASYLLASVWFILQARIMKDYPVELLAVLFFNLSCTIISGPVGLIGEPNLSAWVLKSDIGLIAVLYSGILGSVFSTTVHIWALHIKGPVYTAMFKPLSIAIAALMGVLFLGDSLYLGSIIGAAIISTGFYTVMWGKSREDVCKDQVFVHLESSFSTGDAPLLKSCHTTKEHTTYATV